MQPYLIRRLGRLALVWIGISIVTFVLLRLTGDPARMVLGEQAPDETIAEFNRTYGLDKPLAVQYVAYVGGVLVGDFGHSYRVSQPILELVLERVPATLELSLASLVIAVGLGLPLGVLAALRRDSAIDYIVRSLVLVAQAIPNSSWPSWQSCCSRFSSAPADRGTRDTGPPRRPGVRAQLRLARVNAAYSRSAMLDTLNRPFVWTARSKGLHGRGDRAACPPKRLDTRHHDPRRASGQSAPRRQSPRPYSPRRGWGA